MKKTLSWLLVIAMVFSLMPVNVFAAEGDTRVYFATDFEEEMTIGDTFTVTGYLENNPGMATMTVSLKWNEDVVKFNGFATEFDEDMEEDVLVTDVFKSVWDPAVNHELGIITASRAKNTSKEGVLFVANFEIVGSGDLELALKEADETEFQMANQDLDNINPVIDYSAIENLSVAGFGNEGATIPEGAPFTAVTTDAGDILAIEQQDDVNGVPYYIVTIPEDAETAYVTAPDQVVMEDWNTGEIQATAYAYEIENGWNQLFISYNYEESEDGPVVEIPMYMVASDWSGEVELCFVEDEDGYLTHVFGIEDANYACLGMISFRYGEASEEEDTEETYRITVTKAQISDRQTAVDSNIPEASANGTDETPDETIIKVPYSVTKPGFVGGADHVLHGDDYTFWYTDTDNYSYTGLTVTVGGVEVTVPPADDEGKFVIENVEGSVVITVTQTPNSYAVDFDKDLVDGDDTAIYGTDYEFSVILGEGQEVESVTVLDADGNEIPYTYDSDSGKDIIAGSDISGAFTIVVTLKDIAPTETTITFDGVQDSEVEGGLVRTAKIGKAFSFKLNKDEKFIYTVMVGDTELTEKGGEYTIPASLVVEGGVVVTIIKEAIRNVAVDVSTYINLDGKTMFLVTAKWDDHVLSHNGETMYYSSRYTVTGADEAGAYCWLVISTDEMNTMDQVKAVAEEAITAVDGVTATVIGYDYDVNETTQVDVNDAQLAYDMYNASYMEFTEHLPVLKFLEADVSTDGKLDVQDVAATLQQYIDRLAEMIRCSGPINRDHCMVILQWWSEDRMQQ